jgi:hypothetical protein
MMREGKNITIRSKVATDHFITAAMLVWEAGWIYACLIVSTEYLYGRQVAEAIWNIHISEKSANPGGWLMFAIPFALGVAFILLWQNFGREQCVLTPTELRYKPSIFGFGWTRILPFRSIEMIGIEPTKRLVRPKFHNINDRSNILIIQDGKTIRIFKRHLPANARAKLNTIIQYCSQHGFAFGEKA